MSEFCVEGCRFKQEASHALCFAGKKCSSPLFHKDKKKEIILVMWHTNMGLLNTVTQVIYCLKGFRKKTTTKILIINVKDKQLRIQFDHWCYFLMVSLTDINILICEVTSFWFSCVVDKKVWTITVERQKNLHSFTYILTIYFQSLL